MKLQHFIFIGYDKVHYYQIIFKTLTMNILIYDLINKVKYLTVVNFIQLIADTVLKSIFIFCFYDHNGMYDKPMYIHNYILFKKNYIYIYIST